MTTVSVDFNAMARGGLVKASTKRATGPLSVGQRVVAVDEHEDDMAFDAVVRSIEDGRVYLKVIWQ